MDEKMKQQVEGFLRNHVYCTIATCSGAAPLATVVVYVSDGLDLIFFSGESTKKLRDIRDNPQVAVAVQGRRYLCFPQAVEIQGRAEILCGMDAGDAEKIYFTVKKPEILAAKRVSTMAAIKWVRIHPMRIFTYGFGTKPWELHPAKQFKRVI